MTGLSHDDVASADRRASCLRHTKQLLRTIETVLCEVPAAAPLSDRALQQLAYILRAIEGLVNLFDDEQARLARIAAIQQLSERTETTPTDGA